MSAAVGGAGAVAASPAATAGAAGLPAVPVACGTVPLNVIEWTTGAELSPGLDALRANAGVADRLAWELVSKWGETVDPHDQRAYHALFERLEALRATGITPSSAPIKERSFAALFQPMRDVRARVVAACARPGEPRRFRAADIAGSPRVRIIQLVALLGIDAPIIDRMAADCEAALTAAEPLCSRLEVAYDGLDLTPARVAQRLHMLRMDGVGSISGPSDEEREYAAVFKPVRKYRQELREHISGKGAAAAAAPGDASVMRAATMQLAAHEQSTQLGSAACHVLSEVGARDSEATPGMRAAAFSLVAACMAAHDGHEEIIKYACPAMTALGRGLVATTDAWFPTEGIAVALRALQRYGSSAGIVSAAMYSLYRWTPQAGVAEAIVAAGAIRPCAAALAKHSRDLDVAKSACGLLCGLSDVPGAIATVAAAGGIPPVVEALALHASNRDLAEIACAALRKVVTRMPELTAAVLAADAIPPVVAAMSAHVHDDGVAEPACAVVSQIVQNLCESGAKTDVGVASRAIASSGAALAHHHRESETVTVMGCMTLGVLVTDDAAYRGFVKAGGIPAMVSVLKAAGTQPRSPVSAPLLFSRLAEASAGYRRAIHAAGGIPALVGAMSAVLAKPSDTTADFVCFATEALQSMLAEPEHAAAMVSAGVVPAIVTLLHANITGQPFTLSRLGGSNSACSAVTRAPATWSRARELRNG